MTSASDARQNPTYSACVPALHSDHSITQSYSYDIHHPVTHELKSNAYVHLLTYLLTYGKKGRALLGPS